MHSKEKIGIIVTFQEYPYPCTPRKATGNSQEDGVSKAKIFKGKCEAKLEFPEGWESSNEKNLPWVGYGYFLEQHIVNTIYC